MHDSEVELSCDAVWGEGEAELNEIERVAFCSVPFCSVFV